MMVSSRPFFQGGAQYLGIDLSVRQGYSRGEGELLRRAVMPQAAPSLDRVFRALADPTRRSVLERLSQSPASVSELVEPFNMALPSFVQHLRVLEDCQLVSSRKSGRVRTYQLVPQRLKLAEGWLARQRSHWETRLNQLDDYLRPLKEKRDDPSS